MCHVKNQMLPYPKGFAVNLINKTLHKVVSLLNQLYVNMVIESVNFFNANHLILICIAMHSVGHYMFQQHNVF